MTDNLSTTAFSRLELLFGEVGLKRLSNAHVAIVGLGAVGSFAAEALARTAIGEITLIDFDLIGETNINRQLFALNSTVGQAKVEVAAQRLFDINPKIKLNCHQVFYHHDTAASLLDNNKFDFLIDAIDGAAPKLDLIRNCLQRKINFISAMGAAGRSRPNLVEIGDLMATTGCPLAKVMRKQLRREGVGKGDVTVVYSPEPIAVESLAPESFCDSEREEFFQRGRRRRIQPSAIFMPGVFGLLTAQYAVDEILRD